MKIGDKLLYHGESGGAVIYGENVRVIRLIPSLTYFDVRTGEYYPPDTTWDIGCKFDRFIGDWCEVESTDEPGVRFKMPQGYFHAHQTNHCGICRAKGPVEVKRG